MRIPDGTVGRDTLERTDGSWIDRESYPFDSRFVDLDQGTMHYADEGKAKCETGPIIMLHGNPTWSFLYRHLITGLADEYRCVAPDYFGFGLSDNPPKFSYRPEDHAATIGAFVNRLGLDDLTIVCQDWGGPIGLSYAISNPENVRALVVMNSFCWPVDDQRHFRAFSRLAGGFAGRILCERVNAFVRIVMPLAYADRSRLTPAIHRHYLEPLAAPADRTGTWVFPRRIVGSTAWLSELWERRAAIREIPTLLVWGTADPAFRTAELRTFEALFANARTIECAGVGHYVQEELGPDLVPPVREFLADVGEPGTDGSTT